MRYLSVCSGIEAASVAWEPLGWTSVGFAEIEAFPSRVLAHHWPRVPNFGDFTAIPLDALGQVDLLVGGTPCQAFSVAGKRLSLADVRGNLSLAYTVLAHDLARSHGLRWCVWENVPGVLSTGDNALGCFLGALVGGDGPVEPVARPRVEKSNAFWRWRKAGVEIDDDGNEYEVGAGHVTRWPSAGMVAGPVCRAAWRVLDAQYFGLAQRRRRVFVVAGFGDGADPAEVLFERAGVRRHPPSRGEAGQGVARTLAASSGGSDENDAVDGRLIATTLPAGGNATGGARMSAETAATYLVAYGGNYTRGSIDIATAVNVHGGPHGRQDFESETFVTHALRADGFDANEDGTGRGTPIVPICFDPRQVDVLVHGDKTGPIDTKYPGPAIAFAPDLAATLTRGAQSAGEGSYAGRRQEDDANVVAFQGRGSNLDLGQDVTGTLSSNADRASGGAPCVATAWAVRRLMPVETERLQGFSGTHTALPGAADGPRYKTHGNSMAVNVMAWIGQRIAAADAVQLTEAAE